MQTLDILAIAGILEVWQLLWLTKQDDTQRWDRKNKTRWGSSNISVQSSIQNFWILTSFTYEKLCKKEASCS